MNRKQFVTNIVTAFVKHMEDEFRRRPSRDDGIYIQGATEMAARMIVNLCGGSREVISSILLLRKETARMPVEQVGKLTSLILHHIDNHYEPRKLDL